MKLFIYKSLIFFFLLFIFFQVTFGYILWSYENKIMNQFSKDKIIYLKSKIKEEISDALKKDRILSDEEADLLSNFINKLSNELDLKNNKWFLLILY